MRNRRRPLLIFGALMLATAVQGGCVTSFEARYRRHLTSVVPGASEPDADVALAFGLRRQPDRAVAQGDGAGSPNRLANRN